MPIPTRSKSVKLTPKVEVDATQEQQGAGVASHLSRPKTLSTRADQSTSNVQTKSVLRSQVVSTKPDQGSTSTRNERRSGGTTNTNVSATTQVAAVQSSLNRSESAVQPGQNPNRQSLQQPALFGHTRNLSNVPTTSRHPAKGHQRTNSIPTARLAPKSEGTSSLKKPAFNTFQQHYSPRKPQRTEPVSLTPPSEQVRSETSDSGQSAIRDELLQLQILHQDSIKTYDQYQKSANQHIHDIRRQLQAKEAAQLQLRKDQTRLASLDALQKWLEENPDYSDDQQIQHLAQAFERIGTLLQGWNNPEGPFCTFTSWFENATLIRSNRELGITGGQEQLVIPSLSCKWRQQMADFERKSSAVITMLRSLGVPQRTECGISALIKQHLLIIETLKSQSQVALQLEEKIMSSERKWMSLEVETALSEHKDWSASASHHQHVPVWHVS